MSQIRQNFEPESEALLNRQINMELHAAYVYHSMASNIQHLNKVMQVQIGWL